MVVSHTLRNGLLAGLYRGTDREYPNMATLDQAGSGSDKVPRSLVNSVWGGNQGNQRLNHVIKKVVSGFPEPPGSVESSWRASKRPTYSSPGGGDEAVSKRAERATGGADALRPDQPGPCKRADFRCWSVVLLFAFAGTIGDAG